MRDLKFKISIKRENWPHILTLMQLGLGKDNLSEGVRRMLSNFNSLYLMFMEDGKLSDKEILSLKKRSEDISKAILKENKALIEQIRSKEQQIKSSDQTKAAVGILGGIALLIGAIFGIRNL